MLHISSFKNSPIAAAVLHQFMLLEVTRFCPDVNRAVSLQAGSDTEEQAEAKQPSVQQPAGIADAPDLDPEATVMMTRKQRGLYNAMQRGLSKKRERAENLQAKAKKLKQPKQK